MGVNKRISKKRAVELAKKQILKHLTIEIDSVSDNPSNLPPMSSYKVPKDCWYVLCPNAQGKRQPMLDGESRLICISKKTGKVLKDTGLSK